MTDEKTVAAAVAGSSNGEQPTAEQLPAATADCNLLVKGGQGRSGGEVMTSGETVWQCLLAAALIFILAFGLLGCEAGKKCRAIVDPAGTLRGQIGG